MIEIMEVDRGNFERVPSVSKSVEDLASLTIYMVEAETIDESRGVLIYIPFAAPKDLMDDLRGESND